MHRRRRRSWPFAALAATGALALVAAGAPPGRAQDPLGRALAEQQLRAKAAPDDARVWNDLGNLQALDGDVAAAEASYRRALAADPASGTAHYNLGRLLLDSGRRREARRELARAVELDPTHGAAHYYLGAAYEASGRLTKARRAYGRAFVLDPQLADPASNPHVTGSRQALAAQLLAWISERPPGPSRRYEQTRAIAEQARLEPSAGDAAAVDAEPRAGGVVRSAGESPPGDSVAPDDAATEDPDRAAPELTTTRPESVPGAPVGLVVRSGDLRANRVVNQAGATAGDATGGSQAGRTGARDGRTAPGRTAPGRTPPGRTGRATPFKPPPSPFLAQPDSTGRLETVLEPPPEAGIASS